MATPRSFQEIDSLKQVTFKQVLKKCGLFEKLFAVQTSENAQYMVGSRIISLKGQIAHFAEEEADDWRRRLNDVATADE